MKKGPMRCGNCGGGLFAVAGVEMDDGMEGHASISVTCAGCKSETIIKPAAPRLDLEWGEGAEGRISHFAGDPDDP